MVWQLLENGGWRGAQGLHTLSKVHSLVPIFTKNGIQKMYQSSRVVSYVDAYISLSFSDLRTISLKKKVLNAQQWLPMPVAHMRLPGVWSGPDSTATAGHSKCLTGFCTWAQRGWGDRQYVGVLLWNVVHGSCKQPLRQRWQMFPNIRLGK